MAGGWSTQSRVDDLDDIDSWMAQRNADAGLRQQANAVGRDLWNQATCDGTDLAAPQSSDLTAIGMAALGGSSASDALTSGSSDVSAPIASNAAGRPNSEEQGYGIITARPGDSISRLLGTSRPEAIGRFASLNGLDGSTLKVGSSYRVPTTYDDATPDEIAVGNQLLRSDNARLAAAHASAANDAQTNLFAQRLNSGLNLWTGEAPDYAPPLHSAARPDQQPWWSTPVKALAGTVAFAAGLPVGLVRGGVHLGQGIGDGLDFSARLLDPHDAENHLPGESAWDQVADRGRGVLRYGQQRLTDPGKLADDVSGLAHEARVALDPFPIAPTVGDQIRHSFSVGENGGEGGFDVGTLWDGGGLVNGLRGAEVASDATKAARYLRPGAHPELAAYLAEPYPGVGAHFVPRRAKFPEAIMGVPLPEGLVGKPLLPRAYMDSPFNVWKPDGISRGDFYAGHFRRDDQMYGARLPKDVDGGRGWSGNRVGLQRYSPVGRIWHGAPSPLKAAAGAGSATLGLGTYDYLNEGVPE